LEIVGRYDEIKSLNYLTISSKPEFVAVYGRLRVEKLCPLSDTISTPAMPPIGVVR
jgi:hypothetical protein